VPFYIRKSVKAGPFRFNFSKGGIGVSVGVKGLRVGTGPRGHYVHAGRGGLYYRATLGTAGKRRPAPGNQSIPAQLTFEETGVGMVEIESGNVMQMRDENVGELLDEINAKATQWRLSALLGWLFTIVGIVLILKAPPIGVWVLIAALPAWALGSWFDSYRRSTVLFYDIDGPVEQAYKETISAFDALIACAGKWHIEAGGAISDLTTWKRNAGASYLVKRTATKLAYALPKVIKSNITPPSIHVGKQIIYFMPDVALVEHGSSFGAVSYSDLRIRWQESRFIEGGSVPRDAKIVDHTWQHPNRSGGPDRRFRNNRQLPVCLYDTLHLQSDSGLNELLEFSQTGKLTGFVAGCHALARAKSEASQAQKVVVSQEPSSTAVVPSSPVPMPDARRNRLPAIAFIVGGILALPVAIAAFQNAGQSTRTGTTQSVADAHPGKSASTSVPDGVTVNSGPVMVTQPAQLPDTDASASTGAAASSTPALEADPGRTPDPAVFESLAASAIAPDASPAITAAETPGVPYNAPPEPKFAYLKQAVQLRDGPGSNYIPVGAVGQNALLAVLETEGGWIHVSGGSSTIGWVPKELLGPRPVALQAAAPRVQSTLTPTTRQGGR
jgi:hypothetical protein